MKETRRESPPRVDTSAFSLPDRKSTDETEPAGSWSIPERVCGCGETENVQIVKTVEYGQRALCGPCRADMALVGEVSCYRGVTGQSARDGRARRSGAREDGRGDDDSPTCALAMNASNSTSPGGENTSGRTYRQKCLECDAEWSVSAGAWKSITCPSCGDEAPRLLFSKWYWMLSGRVPGEIVIRAPPEAVQVARELEEQLGNDAEEFLFDVAVLDERRVVPE